MFLSYLYYLVTTHLCSKFILYDITQSFLKELLLEITKFWQILPNLLYLVACNLMESFKLLDLKLFFKLSKPHPPISVFSRQSHDLWLWWRLLLVSEFLQGYSYVRDVILCRGYEAFKVMLTKMVDYIWDEDVSIIWFDHFLRQYILEEVWYCNISNITLSSPCLEFFVIAVDEFNHLRISRFSCSHSLQKLDCWKVFSWREFFCP